MVPEWFRIGSDSEPAVPSLSIKDVPEDVVQRLRERAARNHRSLQGELMALITEAAAPEAPVGAPGAAPRQAPKHRQGKSVAQIAREHRARWPAPVSDVPRAVDIVRAERDAR
jgi:plasmid stability protein